MKLNKEERLNLRMYAVDTAVNVIDGKDAVEEVVAKAQVIYEFITEFVD